MFKVTIHTDGAAFKDPDGIRDEEYEGAEICRILKSQVINYIVNSNAFGGKLLDINGNIVGEWSIWEGDDEE